MCGIAGYWRGEAFERGTADDVVTRMTRVIQHRGPDDSGAWVDADIGLALGHRRLSILDLSPAGHQPMLSHGGRYCIVFNGEIYNHLDLRARLSATWRGTSDTETLLACIEEWGLSSTLSRVVGMFAFALWDSVEHTLHLVRDRFGEKPLYYGFYGGALVFASELKSLRVLPGFAPELDLRAVDAILRHSYIPSPLSVYSGIAKLPPGGWLRVSRRDVESNRAPPPERYWSVAAAAAAAMEDPYTGTFADAEHELAELLRTAVSGQRLADVPLGAFLSGGIDSSLVVAAMQIGSTQRTSTFSIGVDDVRFDERRHARAVAVHLKTDHHEKVVTARDALATVSRLSDVWDEPFADSSQIPTLLLCEFASRHVKVALSGDGGDELFLGYNHYRYLQWLWRGRYLGNRLLTSAMGSLAEFDLPLQVAQRSRTVAFAMGVLAQRSQSAMIESYMDRWRGLRCPWPTGPASDLLVDDIPDDRFPMARRAAIRDASMYLPDDILVKVDRASMHYSLETRAPLLDHRIAEFALRVPVRFHVEAGRGKRLLRAALARVVPRNLFERPKQGFSVPVAAWLRGELREWAAELVTNAAALPAFIDGKRLADFWTEHQRGFDHSVRLWNVLMLLEFVRKQGLR